jgi:hypothetical protein
VTRPDSNPGDQHHRSWPQITTSAPKPERNSAPRKLIFKTILLYTLSPLKALKTSGQQEHPPATWFRDVRSPLANIHTLQRSKNTTISANDASPGMTHHPNIGRDHMPTTPYSNRSRLPSRPSQPATHTQQTASNLHQANQPPTFIQLQHFPNPQLRVSEQARTEGINSQAARPPLTSQHNKHQNTHQDGNSLSPFTSAISARYRVFPDHGSGLRHPEPQEETQRPRTTTKNQQQGNQSQGKPEHRHQISTEFHQVHDPHWRSELDIWVPGPWGLFLTPRTTEGDPKVQNNRNKPRDPEPPQRTSNGGTNQKANQSTGTKF